MTEQQPEVEAPEAGADPAVEPGEQDPTPADEWQSKFEAQQKINRDLEAKLKKSAQNDGHARAKELEARLAQFEGREAEYQAEQEKRATEQAALEKANDRIRRAEIRAAAAGKLADPQDALLHIDVSSFEVGDDGEVDGDAISSAISDLITRKPYLAVQDGKRFQGDADAGTRKEARPAQLSEQDVKRLAAEGKHDEIVKAKAEGRLTDYLAS